MTHPTHADPSQDIFAHLSARLAKTGCPHSIHSHAPTRTVAEAEVNLDFDTSRIVKTIAFALRSGDLVLAALRGTRRVAYPALAGLLGVGRKDIAALAPEDVIERLGVAPGSVSPLLAEGRGKLLVDADVLMIRPTVYCGLGRADRTLEIAPRDLVEMTGGVIGEFSKG
jgi:Cys-tRNA(Pro)/Cys-tRNA(Cys) deacylase